MEAAMGRTKGIRRKYTNQDAADVLGIRVGAVGWWRWRGWIVDHPDGTLDLVGTLIRMGMNPAPPPFAATEDDAGFGARLRAAFTPSRVVMERRVLAPLRRRLRNAWRPS